MPIVDLVSLGVLVAIAIGVWYGRRKGKARFAAAVSAARAEGHADARAELAAQLVNVVQVDNSSPVPVTRPDDPIIDALRREAVNRGSLQQLDAGEHNGSHVSADDGIRSILDNLDAYRSPVGNRFGRIPATDLGTDGRNDNAPGRRPSADSVDGG